MSTDVFDLPEHPAAAAFPMMSDAELNNLAEDIRANGLREPVSICQIDGEWLLLDGRNRREACKRAKVECKSLVYRPEGGHVEFVVSRNIHRRHLSDGQRASIAARLANLDGAGRPRHPVQVIGSIEPIREPVTIDSAASLMNVTRANVKRAREVLKSGAPELVKALDNGEVSVSAAATVAKLPVEVQKKAVEEKTVAAVAKEVREAERQEREAVTGVAFSSTGEAPSFGPPRGDLEEMDLELISLIQDLDDYVRKIWSHGLKSNRVQYFLKQSVRGWDSVESKHPEWRNHVE